MSNRGDGSHCQQKRKKENLEIYSWLSSIDRHLYTCLYCLCCMWCGVGRSLHNGVKAVLKLRFQDILCIFGFIVLELVKGQGISEWKHEVKNDKNLKNFALKFRGHNIIVHILAKVTTSYFHSEISCPLALINSRTINPDFLMNI